MQGFDFPDNPIDRVLAMKSTITARGTGGAFNDYLYKTVRSELVNDPMTANLVPAFVRRSYDEDALWTELSGVASGGGSYGERRKFINAQFAPLLDYLETGGSAADEAVTAVLTAYDARAIQAVWSKALDRRSSDPEGAVTAASTLLEEVCKHIIEDTGGQWEKKWNIPKLYGEAAKALNLAPSQHQEELFKSLLGSCQNIVQSLGAFRNDGSDAHAGGRLKVRPAPRHAALAVNLAGSMALFLIETWQARQNEKV